MGKRGWPKGKPRKKIETIRPQIIEERVEIPKNSIKEKIEALHFIRIYDLRLIPRYLFEQVKPQNFDLNEVYAMARNFERDPLTLLYALADESHKIRGFLWCHLNTILKTVDVQVFTVDKEYQDRGRIISKAKEFVAPLNEKTGYRLRGITSRPKALSRFGFKETGEVIVEMEVEK